MGSEGSILKNTISFLPSGSRSEDGDFEDGICLFNIRIIKEHHNVRSNVGLFDVSHMGEVTFKGPVLRSRSSSCYQCTKY